MANDPITGPLSREEFRCCVEAPFGGAAAIIRTYDPLFGLRDGQTIKRTVRAQRRLSQTGYATVEASSEEEAVEVKPRP